MLNPNELDVYAKRAFESGLAPEQGYGPDKRPMSEAEIFMVMQAGQECGFPPATSLRMIGIYHGGLYLYAVGMNAAIHNAGHSIKVLERSDTKCRLVGIRRGSEVEHFAEFSMDDAKQAGLVGKVNRQGKKIDDAWAKYPSAMLYNRALTMLARQTFPECVGGMIYSKDELKEIHGGDDGGNQPIAVSTAEWVADAKQVMERIYSASPEFGQKADQAIYSQHGATLDHLGGRANRDEILAQITAWANEAEARAAKAAEPAETDEQPTEAPEPQGTGELPLEDVSDPDLGGHRDPA